MIHGFSLQPFTTNVGKYSIEHSGKLVYSTKWCFSTNMLLLLQICTEFSRLMRYILGIIAKSNRGRGVETTAPQNVKLRNKRCTNDWSNQDFEILIKELVLRPSISFGRYFEGIIHDRILCTNVWPDQNFGILIRGLFLLQPNL